MNNKELTKLPGLRREYLEDIGAKIKDLRKKRSVTQEILGAMIGVQKAQICKIESGKNLTTDTISKVFGALRAKVRIEIEPEITPAKERQVIDQIVTCVSLFSELFSLTYRQSFNYLKRYGGIEYLRTFSESNNTSSPEVLVNKMYMICKQNGGGL